MVSRLLPLASGCVFLAAVAIVAVIFYNYFQTRIERIEATLTIASNRVLDAIHLGRLNHGTR